MPPLREPPAIPDVAAAVRRLRPEQSLFELTGGTHAAGAFAENGELLAFAEDVGRHNAVDKVVGQLGRAHGSRACLLALSSRVADELVLKAWRAGIPAVAGVSAPTSAAITTDRRANLALYAFCRGDRLTQYAPAPDYEY